MKTVWELVKLNLIQTYSPSTKISKSKSRVFFLGLGIILGMIYIGVIFYLILSGTLDLLISINQPGLIVFLFILVLSVLGLFFGMISAPGNLYFSQDTNKLLTMPLKSWQIIFSKYLSNLIATWVSGLAIVIPFTIVYMIKIPVNGFFPVFVILAAMIAEIIPYTIAITITILVFSVIPANKFKNIFMYVGMFLSIALSIALSQAMQPIMRLSMENPMAIIGIISGENSLLSSITTVLPTINWLVSGIIDSNILWILLAALVSIVITVVVIYLLQPLYFLSIQKIGENTSTTKKLSNEKLNKSVRSTSALRKLQQVDFKTILRTPVLVMNYFATLVMIPPIIGFSIYTSLQQENIKFAMPEVLATIQSIPQDIKFSIIILVGIMISIFMTSMSTTASTSFSREGREIISFLDKPISLLDLILSKFLIAFKISLVPTLLIQIGFNLLLPISILENLVLFLSMLIGSIFILNFGLILDMIKPKLIWDNIQQGVKGNLFTVIPIFAGIGIVTIMAILVILNIDSKDILLKAAFGFAGVFLALDLISSIFIWKKGPKILLNSIRRQL